MANFGQFLAKTVKIIKKALGTFFSNLQALTNCKVSQKSNERFPTKRVADGRTDATPKVSTTSWSRDQKGLKNTYFQVFTGFPAIPATSKISQICVNFSQKGPFLKFTTKSEKVIFFRLQRLCFEQK